jgi:gamma-glutamyl-gamma-aminobutyrate hydrolase PuuD
MLYARLCVSSVAFRLAKLRKMANRQMNIAEDRAVKRPVVLLTPDLVEPETEETERHYALRENYAQAIATAGGIPLIVPFEREQIASVLEIADGVVITGTGPGAEVARHRVEFERDLIGKTLEAGKPLLGICHGMQLIGECLGGHVLRDLPDMLAEVTPHIPSAIPNRLAHGILIETNSNLAKWAGQPTARVNSLHRHILAGAGRFRITARAEDGIAEAIEGLGGGFCLGVQWHPEYGLTGLDRRILGAFIERCAEAAAARSAASGLGPADIGLSAIKAKRQ